MINFIFEHQIPVDISDQPVFAFSKEVQLLDPTGPDKYVCLLGDLHIEQSLLGLHIDIIKGSALDTVMNNANLSSTGTSMIVDVNDVKRFRYCL